MIGNDIVDLVQAARDSNWQRPGFLNKLFTHSEQAFIHSAANPEQMVWLLWSLKESAYKAQFRETEQRVFAPKKIVCHVHKLTETVAEATVVYEREYRASSIITPIYISSVACLPAMSPHPIHSVVPFAATDYQNQRIAIRRAVINHIASQFAVLRDAVSFHKTTAGIPVISVDSRQIPVSLSHHGRYGAYAFDAGKLDHVFPTGFNSLIA